MGGLFGKKGQNSVDQRLNAIEINQSTYGNPIPLVYGKTRIPSNLGWYGAFTATPHTQKLGGGKGGGGGSSTTSFTYSAALILLLCDGPGIGMGTVWADKAQKALSDLGLTLFAGAGGQAVWSYLTTNFPSQAIPYDHTAYVASGSFDLGGSAQLPNLTFEVKALKPFNAGTIDDAEITDIIVDYLLDANHGAQFNYLGGIQGGGATTLQTYCIANGFFISPAETTQRSAVEFLKELLTIANSEAVWSAGFLKMIPYGNEAITGNGRTYTPVLTPQYTFTDDDYCPDDGEDPVITTRKASSQTYNRVRVEFLDRAQQYNVAIAEATDANDIALNGERAMPTVTLHSITTLSVARLVAQLILQRQLYIRNTFEFKVRSDYSLLEPMDLVAINDSAQGIVNQLVRIVETGDEEDDRFSIVAEEVPVGPAAAPAYNWQAAAGYAANYFGSPGSISAPLIFALPTLLSGVNGGYELAIAASGAGGLWGGCDVYMSLDNTTYAYVGTIAGPARYGTLRATFATGADPDDANTLQLQLANTGLTMQSGTTADENNLVTLMYVDGEIMSYRTATLVGTGQYDLTHMRRGKYGSTIGAHSSGTKWARIDSGLFRVPYDPGMLGQTVYFKFPSFNYYGQAHETLAAATAYSYVLQNANAGQNLPNNATFVARGNCATVGDKFFKSGGSAAYDSDVYSIEAYSSGCVLRFRALAGEFLLGLNSDPLTDQNYTSLDFCFVARANGNVEMFESGSGSSVVGTWTTATVFSITYDGLVVRYYLDGVLKRETPAPGKTLFVDSSFLHPAAAAADVFFGQNISSPSSRLVARGNCVIIGNSIQKRGGSSAWDSDCYSTEAFPAGCQVSFRPAQTTANFMIGLNTDPTTDQSYSSLDFAWNVTSTPTLEIYESGSLAATLGAYTTANVLSIKYDGYFIRYFVDGIVQRTVAAPGLVLTMDSSFNSVGAIAADVNFGPLTSATPSLYVARGNCIVSDDNVQKQGGSGAWDSDVYSIVGYPVCNLQFKANATDKDLIIGLNADPAADLSYTSVDYGWNCDSAGGLHIYESGSEIGSTIGGAYTAATVFSITYDGTTITYWKDGVSIRTHTDAGKTFFLDSSFYTAGGGINSLRFGPTANLAVADTSQIGLNAASLSHLGQATSVTITQLDHIGPIQLQAAVQVTFTPTVTCTLRCTMTCAFTYVAGGASAWDGRFYVYNDASAPPARNPLPIPNSGGITTHGAAAQTIDIACVAGVPITIDAGFSKFNSADTLTIDSVELSVVEMRR